MSLLEDRLKRNKDLLDTEEPSAGHLERFEKKLGATQESKKEKKLWPRSRSFRVAAVAVILLGLSLAIYLAGPDGNGGQVLSNALPDEIQKAKLYYESEAQQTLRRIDQCAATPEEATKIRQMAEEEFKRLDASSSELETFLTQKLDNKKVEEALIVNYKSKADLVEDILRRLCKI